MTSQLEIRRPKSEVRNPNVQSGVATAEYTKHAEENISAASLFRVFSVFRGSGCFVWYSAVGFRICVACSLGIALLCSAVSAPPPKPASPAKAAAPEAEIPRSVFTVPTGPKDGRDPFFPNATYLIAVNTSPRKATFDASTLVLNGIIPKVSCMINGKTFYTGDEGDVKDATGGRMHIKVLEVKDDSAVVEAGGERRELHLRQGVF